MRYKSIKTGEHAAVNALRIKPYILLMFTRPEYLQEGTPFMHIGRGINTETPGASYRCFGAVVLVSSVLLTKVHALIIY